MGCLPMSSPGYFTYATAKALHENGSLCFYNESFTVSRKHD